MGSFLKLLKVLLPLAKAAAAATPNKVDDAVIALIEEVLAVLPAEEAAALAKVAEMRGKIGTL